MNKWPLRWQITSWAALAMGFALAVFGTVVAFEIYSQQVETIDDQLITDADLAFIADLPNGQGRMLENLAHLPRGNLSLYGYAVGRAGKPASIQARPQTLARLLSAASPAQIFFNRKIEGHWLRIGIFHRQGTSLLLATSLHRALDGVSDLMEAYAVACPLVLLVAAGGSWWIARRALAPIREITRAAAAITADRLHERLSAPASADEIGRHIQVLNGMLDRLQRSFEQANRFTADAAHELRTPLTIIRGQIEEALRSLHGDPAQERLLIDLLEETIGLQKISDNLLLLARFDTGRNTLQLASIDFSALVQDAGEDAELLGAPKGITVDLEIAPAIRLYGDATMLRRVLLNLLDNAVKFNRSQGKIGLVLRADRAQEARLSIGNTGLGISAENQGALFERFYRGVEARDQAKSGSGLGLSLCREIVEAHRGRIELGRSEADWTEFIVILPLA